MRFLALHQSFVFVLAAFVGCNCPPAKGPDNTSGGSSGVAGSSTVSGSAGVGAGGGASCVPAESASLDLDLFAQESDMLCWASVTQMIAQWAGTSITQCDQVKADNATCTCQTCPSSAAMPYGPCNQGGWPHFAQARLHADRSAPDTPLTLAQLKQELGCARRPVAFTWHTGPGTGHIMVAYGYDGDFIAVLDPWAPCEGDERQISYDEYVSGNAPGTTSHWDDFYGIRREVLP